MEEPQGSEFAAAASMLLPYLLSHRTRILASLADAAASRGQGQGDEADSGMGTSTQPSAAKQAGNDTDRTTATDQESTGVPSGDAPHKPSAQDQPAHLDQPDSTFGTSDRPDSGSSLKKLNGHMRESSTAQPPASSHTDPQQDSQNLATNGPGFGPSQEATGSSPAAAAAGGSAAAAGADGSVDAAHADGDEGAGAGSSSKAGTGVGLEPELLLRIIDTASVRIMVLMADTGALLRFTQQPNYIDLEEGEQVGWVWAVGCMVDGVRNGV